MAAVACSPFESPLPYTAAPASAAVLFCSDGRLGEHVDRFADRRWRTACVDRLAVPGGAACLAGHWATWRDERALRRQVQFLAAAHRLVRLALVAHQDCGHYAQRLGLLGPAALRQQVADLQRAADRLRRLCPDLHVEAYYAHHDAGRVTFQPFSV